MTVERYFGGLIPWSFADVRWSREIDGNRLNALPPRRRLRRAVDADLAVLAGSAGAISTPRRRCGSARSSA